MTYTISCCGCGTTFKFRSMERIGVRVRQHRCGDATESSNGQSKAPESGALAAGMRK